MKDAKYRFLLLPLILVFACVGAFAQANSELTGIVRDQTGAVVPGAKIIIVNQATNNSRTTSSDSSGLYDFSGLNPGKYNLKASATGFKGFIQSGIVINTSATFRVDVELTVGAETQTVTVAADALTVQMDSNEVTTLLTSQDVENLAVANRNVTSLAQLGMGVSSENPDFNAVDAAGATFNISFNGLAVDHNVWMIDGGESYDRGSGGDMANMPSMDAISEFQVLASNFPPDYGIASGGIISMTIKNGAQKYHGTLYEENRNTDYDATPEQATAPVETHYNIYGGNLGGPLYIPGIYNRNKQKTFFFVNEEWRKVISPGGETLAPTLPSSDFPIAGQDLTYTPPPFGGITTLNVPVLGDPAWEAKLATDCPGCVQGQPFPNDTIPAAMFDSNAVLYLNSGIVPHPNITDPSNPNYGYNIAFPAVPLDVRDDVVRIDHHINDKWNLMGHFIHDSVTASAAAPDGGWGGHTYSTILSTYQTPCYAAVVKLTGQIKSNLLLETAFNYDGDHILFTLNPVVNKPTGFTITPVTAQFPIGRPTIFPGIGSSGYPYNANLDDSQDPYNNASEDYTPTAALSYTAGRHIMKVGFSFNRYVKNQIINGDSQGLYQFQGNAGIPSSTGDGMMDLLLGIPTNYQQEQSVPRLHFYANTPSVYAMDNWHVTPRLSLQLGLRYDDLPHTVERQNQLSDFVPSQYQAIDEPVFNDDATILSSGPGVTINAAGIPFYTNGIVFAGAKGTPRGEVNNNYKTLEPRVGFSYDLTGDGKTVIRGGFGTFYERIQLNDVLNQTATAIVGFLDQNNVYFTTPGRSWSTGAVVTPSTLPVFQTSFPSALNQYYPAPAVAQYSLGVQRQLAPAVVWQVQYVGNIDWHQNIGVSINNFPLTTPFATRAAAANNNLTPVQNAEAVTYPGYAGITQIDNSATGYYSGFQTGLRTQNRWGLSGEVDYTWSHEIDSTWGGGPNSSNPDLQNISNPYNRKYDRGSGFYDRRQVLSIDYVYSLPFFNKQPGLVHTVAGGWELAGTVLAETGTPQPLSNGGYGDTVGLGGGYNSRPNVNGKVKYPKTRTEWFDPSVLSVPVAGYADGPNLGFGNAGKDAVVGPGRVNFTASLYKTFAITERANLELKFESFNTFNHPQWDGVAASFNGIPYGQPGSNNIGNETNSGNLQPRNLELGGRLTF